MNGGGGAGGGKGCALNHLPLFSLKCAFSLMFSKCMKSLYSCCVFFNNETKKQLRNCQYNYF